jgi:hypothetical protein
MTIHEVKLSPEIQSALAAYEYHLRRRPENDFEPDGEMLTAEFVDWQNVRFDLEDEAKQLGATEIQICISEITASDKNQRQEVFDTMVLAERLPQEDLELVQDVFDLATVQ